VIKSINSCFLAILLIILIFSFSFADSLQVSSPKDKTVTTAVRTLIEGSATGISEISINNTKAGVEENVFKAVAILRPGKNLISILAVYSGGGKETRDIRILKIVTYDDIEKLYGRYPHWAKPQILSLATLGIIEGYPDNTFQPNRPISRGELATWVARAKGLKAAKPEEDVFFDVPKEHWRAPYIKAVTDMGIMPALSKEMFGIDVNISRSDAVMVFVRAFNISSAASMTKSPFTDVPENSKAAAYIYSAYKKGFLIGIKGKKFEPERSIKRAEVAMVLSRPNSIKESKAILYDFEKGYTAARYCRIGTKPVIKKIVVTPLRQVPDGKTPVKISADVFDAQGRSDISSVWANITALGGPNNAKMNLTEKGLYEISFIVPSTTQKGEKTIIVKVSDKSGLTADGVVKFTVIGEK